MKNTNHALWNYIENKDHVIWDWNGTLLSDVDHAVKSVNHLLVEHGLPVLTVQKYKEVFDFPIRDYYVKLGFDFNKESFESLCDKFVAKFAEGSKDLSLVPSMKPLLHEVQNKSKQQSILSAALQSDLDEMIEHFKLRPLFKHVYGLNNNQAASKVERGHELMKRVNVSQHKTIIIGDTLHDLEVAQELGIDVVLLAHGHQCALRLRKHTDKVIEWN